MGTFDQSCNIHDIQKCWNFTKIKSGKKKIFLHFYCYKLIEKKLHQELSRLKITAVQWAMSGQNYHLSGQTQVSYAIPLDWSHVDQSDVAVHHVQLLSSCYFGPELQNYFNYTWQVWNVHRESPIFHLVQLRDVEREEKNNKIQQ